MKTLLKCALITLVCMYFIGAAAIAVTSGAAAEFYWHRWWMCPVQIFIGIFLFVIGSVLVDKVTSGAPR